MTSVYSNEERYSIANTIWRTLGSQRFQVVTGCKPLVYGEKDGKVYLMMTVGRNKHSVNRFEVSYDEAMDLFNVSFVRKRGLEAHVVASYEQVYCDMIHTLFEQHTGLTTSLPRFK